LGYNRPQTTKAVNKNKKEMTEEKKQIDYSALMSPSGKNINIDITDSDSKQFFDEVFDDPLDLEGILFDVVLIAEARLNDEDQNEEDNEHDIKREIQKMKQGELKLKMLLTRDTRNFNPTDDEEGS
jgi:hypothetical protein